MIEILAPAGGREQLEAAVNGGADAVYLGYGSFNARRNAKNFGYGELCDAVKYCRGRGVKVHATLNTLVTEKEISRAYEDVIAIAKAGVDAVIVQDLGLAKIIHTCVPDLPMHASTQLTVHNKSGMEEVKKLGFSRAVLARELSLKEIEDICANTDLETEVFIHGALCMSVSGGCYLSSVLGQRSGNRGLCAQPCRLDFNVKGREYALSLKDMCHIEYIGALERAGVSSVKIEGRMKRPEYVACASAQCKASRDGEKADIETLKKVFSRSGFTDGYITGKRTYDMFGYRKKEDVEASQDVLKSIENRYRKEVPRVDITVEFSLKENENSYLKVTDGTFTVEKRGNMPEKALNRSITKEDILKQLGKTGNTPFKLKKADIALEDGLILPISAINAMRREALENLLEMREQVPEYKIIPLFEEKREHSKEKREIWVRGETKEQLKLLPKDIFRILPISEADGENTAAEIPSLIFPEDEQKVEKELVDARQRGVKKAVCNNIGAIAMALHTGMEPVGGWGLNVLNSYSLSVLEDRGIRECTVSFETGIPNFTSLYSKSKLALITYGYLPLMRMRACPAKGKNGCGNCTGLNTASDRKNIKFPLVCRQKKYTVLLNSTPLYSGDKNIGNPDIEILYFTLENSERVKQIYGDYINGNAPNFDRTNGLYFKTLK